MIIALEEKIINKRMRLYGHEERNSAEVLNARKGNTQEEDQDEDGNNRLGCCTPRRRKIIGRK
jgi:hypothetical protein